MGAAPTRLLQLASTICRTLHYYHFPFCHWKSNFICFYFTFMRLFCFAFPSAHILRPSVTFICTLLCAFLCFVFILILIAWSVGILDAYAQWGLNTISIFKYENVVVSSRRSELNKAKRFRCHRLRLQLRLFAISFYLSFIFHPQSFPVYLLFFRLPACSLIHFSPLDVYTNSEGICISEYTVCTFVHAFTSETERMGKERGDECITAIHLFCNVIIYRALLGASSVLATSIKLKLNRMVFKPWRGMKAKKE